jgi:hypothetical protein
VGDEQHRGALVRRDDGELLLQVLARHGVDRGERLVHQQHERIVGQHARDGGALAHAAGELVRILVLEALQPDQLDEALRDRRALGLGQALEPRPELDVRAVVFHGSSAYSWNTIPRSAPGPVILRPDTMISPEVGLSRPATRRRKVDLPQPDGPITETNSCGLIAEADVVERHDIVVGDRVEVGLRHVARDEQVGHSAWPTSAARDAWHGPAPSPCSARRGAARA